MSWGYLLRKNQQNFIMFALVVDRDGQESRSDSTVPLWDTSVLQHPGREHNPFLFHGTQCPDRASTLYLPDKSLDWVVAFSISQGKEPQVVRIGWLRERNATSLSLKNGYNILRRGFAKLD